MCEIFNKSHKSALLCIMMFLCFKISYLSRLRLNCFTLPSVKRIIPPYEPTDFIQQTLSGSVPIYGL